MRFKWVRSTFADQIGLFLGTAIWLVLGACQAPSVQTSSEPAGARFVSPTQRFREIMLEPDLAEKTGIRSLKLMESRNADSYRVDDIEINFSDERKGAINVFLDAYGLGYTVAEQPHGGKTRKTSPK